MTHNVFGEDEEVFDGKAWFEVESRKNKMAKI